MTEGRDRAQEALDHLQAAALEMIEAVRAVLDVAEEAVRDPHALREVIASTTRAATQAAAHATHEEPASGRVEHIKIS